MGVLRSSITASAGPDHYLFQSVLSWACVIQPYHLQPLLTGLFHPSLPIASFLSYSMCQPFFMSVDLQSTHDCKSEHSKGSAPVLVDIFLSYQPAGAGTYEPQTRLLP